MKAKARRLPPASVRTGSRSSIRTARARARGRCFRRFTRRRFELMNRVHFTVGTLLLAGLIRLDAADASTKNSAPVAIGSQRELFVDRMLVRELKNASLKLHSPQLMPPVSPPRPNGAYATVLKGESKFQFYYRGD